MMKYLLRSLTFGVLFISALVAHSQTDTTKTNLLEAGMLLAEDMIDWVTFENGRNVFSVFPVAGYTPRTGVEFGVMPVWQIESRDSMVTRPTTLASSLQFSSKGMYEVKLDLVSYLSHNWMLWSKVHYLYLPDEFYGLGNGKKEKPYSPYELNSLVLSADVAKGISEKWYIGMRFDFNYNDHVNIEGDVLNENIDGYKGGWANGIGPLAVFDGRDNVLYPKKGWLLLASSMWYGSYLGSDFDFNLSVFDARKYITVVDDKSILALQAVFNTSSGAVPFYKLPGVGGKHKLRGIPHPHKYIDKVSWYSQAEWRQNVWWRFGAVAFGGVGRVMPAVDSPWLKDLHAIAGLGLRFRALPKDGLNFRIDYGVSNTNESSFFFTIREAF